MLLLALLSACVQPGYEPTGVTLISACQDIDSFRLAEAIDLYDQLCYPVPDVDFLCDFGTDSMLLRQTVNEESIDFDRGIAQLRAWDDPACSYKHIVGDIIGVQHVSGDGHVMSTPCGDSLAGLGLCR